MPTLAWPWLHDASPRVDRTSGTVSDAQIAAIPGWFSGIDIALFRFFLGEQVKRGEQGDLAEMGAYLGASATLIGAFRQPDETFTVVDLFGDAAPDVENSAEQRSYYDKVSQDAFEANYRGVHGDLPVIIRGTSTTIRGRAASGRHRFVHVDASHEFPHVLEDIETARQLLAPDGIVVFDDFRSEYFPGVGAAVWPELANGLVPLALSPEKLYATWGEPERWQRALGAWPKGARGVSRMHQIAGHPVLGVLSESERSRLGEFVPPVLAPVAIKARKLLRF
jgi:Methyltransferase domain